MESSDNELQANKKLSPAVPLIFLVGCAFLLSAYMTGDAGQYFWGGIICSGAVLLHLVRQKDWKKHFEELDKEREARAGSRSREEKKDE